MSNQQNGNSDPLPYTQVDRAVKPKAALLAGAVGISPQHAMGSLVEFWDLCGDPRELERLVSEGKHEVMLTVPEVVTRFKLASGVSIDPSLLVSLGLLEHRGDTFRVRGMSRYFAPIERRVAIREKARSGGLASAAARKAKEGGAQPSRPHFPSRAVVESGLDPGSTRGQPEVNLGSTQMPFVDSGLPLGSGRVEPKLNLSEAAVSGQRSETVKSIVEQARPVGSPEAREVFAYWKLVTGKTRSLFLGKRLKAVEGRLRDGYSVADLKAAIDRRAQIAYVNEQGVVFNDLELICRDATQVEREAGNRSTAPPRPVTTKQANDLYDSQDKTGAHP